MLRQGALMDTCQAEEVPSHLVTSSGRRKYLLLVGMWVPLLKQTCHPPPWALGSQNHGRGLVLLPRQGNSFPAESNSTPKVDLLLAGLVLFLLQVLSSPDSEPRTKQKWPVSLVPWPHQSGFGTG